MRYTLFLQNRIKRQLDLNGTEFMFTHKEEDKYHRGTAETTYELKGIYHEASSYVTQNSTDGSTSRTKPSPMILCLWEDAKPVKIGDTVLYNENKYHVTGVDNVSEADVAAQISLEVILDGVK